MGGRFYAFGPLSVGEGLDLPVKVKSSKHLPKTLWLKITTSLRTSAHTGVEIRFLLTAHWKIHLEAVFPLFFLRSHEYTAESDTESAR